MPLSIALCPSNQHDLTQVLPAIDNMTLKIGKTSVVGDAGYVSKNLKETLKSRGIKLIYPYKKNQSATNTKFEIDLIKKRYLIENVFSWIQNYRRRRLRLRYEKNWESYLQFYYFGITMLISKKLMK